MQHLNDRFSRKHLRNIRNRVNNELGISSRKNLHRSGVMRVGVAFAVFAVCLLTITPALAAEIPEVYDMLYWVLPETAQFFKPVQKSDIDQNIEIKVESVYVHGAEADAVISVRDLSQDRLSEKIDFDDSYDIHTGFDSVGTCSQIDYDATTRTATFLIETSSMHPSDLIVGKKLTISFDTLLSGKIERLAYPISIDWSTISDTVQTEQPEPYFETVLVTGEKQLEVLDGFTISEMGYVEGKLHIQLYTPERHTLDNHASLYLKNEDGTVLFGTAIYRGGYSGDPLLDREADYIDYVFDVPKEELSKYTLMGDFYGYQTRLDGNWSITFPLENDG
ncbi:MAG: hypothetical protein VB061_01390 [Christensenella sp.]|nr:hypothetical protein [Christensenella sp.]